MKKIFLILLVLVVVLAGSAWVFLPKFMSPRLKEVIELRGSKALNGTVSISELQWTSILPLKVSLNNVQVISSDLGLNASVAQADLTVQLLSSLFSFSKVRLETKVDVSGLRANLVVKKSEIAPQKSEIQKPLPPIALPIELDLDSSLDFSLSDGAIEVDLSGGTHNASKKIRLNGLNFLLSKGDIFGEKKPLIFNFGSNIHVDWEGISVSAPIEMSANDIMISTDYKITSQTLKASVAGLETKLSGWSNVETLSHSWKANFSIPDLAALKVPPKFLPPGNWVGSIAGGASFVQENSGDPKISGHVASKGVRGNISYKTAEPPLYVNGPLSALVDAQFSFDKKLSVPKVIARADLSNLNVNYGKLLKKKSGIHLSLALDGYFRDKFLVIKEAGFRIDRLKLMAQGFVGSSPGQSSNLSFQLPKAQLKGLEALSPMLASYPIHGVAELKGKLSGDIYDPQKLNINVSPLKFDLNNAFIKYSDAKSGLKVEGPLSLNSSVNLITQGPLIKKAFANVVGDLTRLNILVKGVANKRAKQPLRFKLKVQQKGSNISLLPSSIVVPGGEIKLKGRVVKNQKINLNLISDMKIRDLKLATSTVQKLRPLNLKGSVDFRASASGPYKLDLPMKSQSVAVAIRKSKIKINDFKTGSVGNFVPEYKSLIPRGRMSAHLVVSGKYFLAKGHEKSPIKVTGNVNLNLARFKYISPPEKKGEKKTKPSKKKLPTKSMLPNWPVVRNSQVGVKVKLNEVNFDKLIARDISMKLKYNKGSVSGSAQTGKVFDGRVKVSKFATDLRKAVPEVTYITKVSKLNIGSALDWAMPEKKGLVKGVASVQAKGLMVHPNKQSWLKEIRSKGSIDVQNVFISTLDLDKSVNEFLGKIKGLGGVAQSKTKGIAAQLKTAFDFKSGQVQFSGLDFNTPERRQILAQGKMNLDLKANIQGRVFVPHGDRGDVAMALDDGKGRLDIPLFCQGKITAPGACLGQKTYQAVMGKIGIYAQAKLKKQAEKKIKQEVDKTKKRLENDLKKGLESGLKNLLGQ